MFHCHRLVPKFAKTFKYWLGTWKCYFYFVSYKLWNNFGPNKKLWILCNAVFRFLGLSHKKYPEKWLQFTKKKYKSQKSVNSGFPSGAYGSWNWSIWKLFKTKRICWKYLPTGQVYPQDRQIQNRHGIPLDPIEINEIIFDFIFLLIKTSLTPKLT